MTEKSHCSVAIQFQIYGDYLRLLIFRYQCLECGNSNKCVILYFQFSKTFGPNGK